MSHLVVYMTFDIIIEISHIKTIETSVLDDFIKFYFWVMLYINNFLFLFFKFYFLFLQFFMVFNKLYTELANASLNEVYLPFFLLLL